MGKPEIKDLNDLSNQAEVLINKLEFQKECLDVLIMLLQITESIKTLVYNRWLKEGMPPLKNFAPYAHFYFLTMVKFNLGIVSGLLPTKSTNPIDLEYFFYAPFANIFCSGDDFHRLLWPIILEPDQTFIDGVELRADLQHIAEHWKSLTDSEKRKYASDFGRYPPQNPNSVTHRVWQKYCKPWTSDSGNQATIE